MKHVHLLGIVLLILIALWSTITKSSGQVGDIVVDGANTFQRAGLSGSAALNQSTTGVTARILPVASNTERQIGLSNVPTPLKSLVDLVPVRILTSAGNSLRNQSVGGLSAQLTNLLSNVGVYTIIEAANSTRVERLSYPRQLINDNQPPVINKVTVESPALQTFKIVWQTNEFTTAVFRYGVQSGIYTEEIRLSEYARSHTIQPSNLEPGKTYYYQITCTDLNENTVTSAEATLTLPKSLSIYLPLIRR